MSMFRLGSQSGRLGLSPRRSRQASAGPPGDTEAPSVPQNLSATAISDDQINLSWDASTDNVGVTGYKIYRDNALVDTSPTNSYSDTGLDPDTEYEYEVSAFDAAANESARSDPDSATTQSTADTEAPSVPQNLSATAISDDQIDLTWDASTDNVGVTGYNIYRDNALVDTSPTDSYSDTGLEPATEYEYEVSAFDAASNESARSAPDSATTHQVIVTAGLVAEWRFDEGAGQVVTDHSGNGNHLQLGPTAGVDGGEPTWAPYGIDCVLNDSNNHLRANGNIGISGTQARTVIGVVQIDTNFNAATNHGASFFAWVGNGPAGSRWTLRNQSQATPLRLETGGGGNNSQSFPSFNFSDESWHFIGATQSGAATNTATVYFDAATANYTNVGTPINTTGNLAVLSQEAAANGSSRWGKMAYGLVYDRALSPAEVEQNRQALKAILAGRGIALP